CYFLRCPLRSRGKELDHEAYVSLLRRAGCAQGDRAVLCAPGRIRWQLAGSGETFRNNDGRSVGDGRVAQSARCDPRGNGIDWRVLEGDLQPIGRALLHSAGQPSSLQAGAGPEDRCEGLSVAGGVAAVRVVARQLYSAAVAAGPARAD